MVYNEKWAVKISRQNVLSWKESLLCFPYIGKCYEMHETIYSLHLSTFSKNSEANTLEFLKSTTCMLKSLTTQQCVIRLGWRVGSGLIITFCYQMRFSLHEKTFISWKELRIIHM